MKKLAFVALGVALGFALARAWQRSGGRLHGTPDHWPAVARKP